MTKTGAILSALAAAAGMTAAAGAQVTPDATISISFGFQEVNSRTLNLVAAPNGRLDPGESALIAMTCSFTGFNTITSFAPPIATFTSGTIRGFGSAILDLIGSANNGGNANGAWVLDGTGDANGTYTTGLQGSFTNNSAPGTPNPTGSSVINIPPGQFPPTSGQIDTSNPVLVWYGVWTPASYAPRTVVFQSAPGSVAGSAAFAAVILRLSSVFAGSVTVPTANVSLGNIQIPIAPAPASFALLGLGALVSGRRRSFSS